MKKSLKLALVSGLTGITLLGSAAFAVADNDNDHPHKVGSTLEVHISDNGKVLVRGAEVTAVKGGTITAANTWGSANMTWTVNTTADTHFVRKNGGASAINEVSVGDFISFQGMLVTTSANL